MKVVNLARRPFVNARPVVRLAVLLWIIGGFLLAANALFYSRYWTDSAEIRGQLAAVEEEMSREEESLAELDQQVTRLDLEEQIDQVFFLNRLIKNRTFPWSALFEDLEEILPPDVRLFSVQPNVRFDEKISRRQTTTRSGRTASGSSRSRPRRTATPERSPTRRPIPEAEGPEEVRLQLPGFAKSDEALMELVDALYANPSFRRPILRSETRDTQRGGVVFSIEVVYLTRLSSDPAAAAAETDSTAIAQESAAPSGEPDAPEVVVADDGSSSQDQLSGTATGTATAAGPSPQDEDERPEVVAATPSAEREALLSRDARSDDSKPEDQSAMTSSARARARLDAIDDDSEVRDGIRSGYRPPAQTGSGYRPPAQTGSGYRPPAQTQPEGRSQDETGSDPSRSRATSTGRDPRGNAPIQPVKPSFVRPSASGTPRLQQGALPPGSRLVEEAWT